MLMFISFYLIYLPHKQAVFFLIKYLFTIPRICFPDSYFSNQQLKQFLIKCEEYGYSRLLVTLVEKRNNLIQPTKFVLLQQVIGLLSFRLVSSKQLLIALKKDRLLKWIIRLIEFIFLLLEFKQSFCSFKQTNFST